MQPRQVGAASGPRYLSAISPRARRATRLRGSAGITIGFLCHRQAERLGGRAAETEKGKRERLRDQPSWSSPMRQSLPTVLYGICKSAAGPSRVSFLSYPGPLLESEVTLPSFEVCDIPQSIKSSFVIRRGKKKLTCISTVTGLKRLVLTEP